MPRTTPPKNSTMRNGGIFWGSRLPPLSEDYVATPEKESAIQSANEKLAKGDQKGAIDTLRLAGIGVIENQYLMPLNQTRKAVAQAQELLKAGKYYEANLVLKGAEEGIVVDSEMLVAGN